MAASLGGSQVLHGQTGGDRGSEARHRVHIPILRNTLPHAVSIADSLRRFWWYGGCRSPLVCFFLRKEKILRKRDFVSGNPLPQQPRIQLAPAAAGLRGDLTDPESSWGSGCGAAWCFSGGYPGLAAPGRVGRRPVLSQGRSVGPGSLFHLVVQIDAPSYLYSLPALISQTASRQGCSCSCSCPETCPSFGDQTACVGAPQGPPKLCSMCCPPGVVCDPSG